MTFADRFEPNIFIFDKYPGGVGFSETLYEKGEPAARKGAGDHRKLPLPRRLPLLRQPGHPRRGNHKAAARFILKLLLERLDN